MSGLDYIVPPRSWDNIAHLADEFRDQLGLSDKARFPVMSVLEDLLYQHFDLLEMRVVSDSEMEGAEGYTCPDGKFIAIAESVYEGAYAGNGRHRFTVAHELGHLVLHSKQPLQRNTSSVLPKAYCRSEPQANQFAAELLMPRRFFTQMDTEAVVVGRHGVSGEAANLRLRYLRGKGFI